MSDDKTIPTKTEENKEDTSTEKTTTQTSTSSYDPEEIKNKISTTSKTDEADILPVTTTESTIALYDPEEIKKDIAATSEKDKTEATKDNTTTPTKDTVKKKTEKTTTTTTATTEEKTDTTTSATTTTSTTVVDPVASTNKASESTTTATTKSSTIIAIESLFQEYFKYMDQKPVLTQDAMKRGMTIFSMIVTRVVANPDTTVLDTVLSIFKEHADDLLSERKALRGCNYLSSDARTRVEIFYALFINKARGKKIAIDSKKISEYLKSPAIVNYIGKK